MSDERVQKIRDALRVTRVVATRSVRGRFGESFAGFTAGLTDDVSDRTGLVADAEEASNGMSLADARIAFYLVAMQADEVAYEAAVAGGDISPEACAEAIRRIRMNYNRLIRMAMMEGSTPIGGG